MTEVFEGVSVVDFTQGIIGSVATMIMSDYGADVIKVEPTGGDPHRVMPGSLQWNRGKRSIILDLNTRDGQKKARKLVENCDVVVENFTPGTAQQLGIDYETLSAIRPDIVYCSVTGWGPKGPYSRYKSYEGAVAAKMGRMMAFANQTKRTGPHYSAVQTATHATNMAAVRGITAALMVRNKTGRGQKVETNLLQAMTPYDLGGWLDGQLMERDPEQFSKDPLLQFTNPQSNPGLLPMLGYLPVRTKDGHWIQMANIVDRPYRAAFHAIGLGYIFEEPRWNVPPFAMKTEDSDELREIMLERFQEKTLDEWMQLFVNEEPDVAAEPFMPASDGLKHPQMIHNGHVQEVDDPTVGKMQQLGPVSLLYDTPGYIKGPAPTAGQHTVEILNNLNVGKLYKRSHGSSKIPKYPLEDVIVLDLATVIAGPLGCALVAEMGARIIRIEPLEGDFGRRNRQGRGAHRTMAGGESWSVDLKTPEGQEAMHKLVAKADVLVHNMRPGAPERIKIGYEHLKEINPRLIYVYAGGYGASGPHSHRPSMHPIPGAVCGGVWAQLGKDTLPSAEEHMTMEEIKEISRRWSRSNEANPDPNSSMAVSVAILLGLYAREQTGNGQYIVSTMLQANAYANADDFFAYEGKPPRPMADYYGYGLNALYRLYEAKNGWVFLACPFQDEWETFANTVGRDDLLSDKRFATLASREKNDEALATEIKQIFNEKEPIEWEMILTSAGVSCVKAEDISPYNFFKSDSHAIENNLTTEVESLRLGKFWRYSPIITFSGTSSYAGSGPLLGQQNDLILRELGYSEEEILDFKARNIINWEEP